MKILNLTGTPKQRGEQHGEELRSNIHDLIGGWQYAIEKSSGRSLDDWCDDFTQNTQFAATMDNWTPELSAELNGIAEGAAVNPIHLYMFNCTDENQWFIEHRQAGIELPEGRGCTSLGTTGTQHPIIAQNMDIPGATDGHQILMHIQKQDSDLEIYLFSISGMLGMIGLNNFGIGVVNNSLRQLKVRPDGLPVNTMVRGILEQTSYAEATTFITTAPHATGHNYIVGGTTGVSMYECSANGALEVPMTEQQLLHTNHPLVNTDLNPNPEFQRNRSTSNTEVRLSSALDLVKGRSTLSVEDAKAVLSSHHNTADPICRHVSDKGTNFTAAAVVYELHASPTLHIAPGPPCEVPFEMFRV